MAIGNPLVNGGFNGKASVNGRKCHCRVWLPEGNQLNWVISWEQMRCDIAILERTPKIPSGFTDIAMDNGQPIYRWLTYQNWWRSIATVSHYKRVSTCSTFEVDIRPLCWTFHAVLLWRPILQAVAAFVFGAYKRLQPPHTNIVNTASHTSHRPRSLA
jgi:hypothetical protein